MLTVPVRRLIFSLNRRPAIFIFVTLVIRSVVKLLRVPFSVLRIQVKVKVLSLMNPSIPLMKKFLRLNTVN